MILKVSLLVNVTQTFTLFEECIATKKKIAYKKNSHKYL